jgi:hypothetical protein
MVFLDGLTEAQAKALTVKMDAKRGKFDPEDLGELLRSIQHELSVEDLALTLGIENDELMPLLVTLTDPLPGDDPIPPNGATPGEVPSGMSSHVKMVQLFFSAAQHEEFQALVKKLAPEYGLKDTTATTLEAMRRAGAAQKSRS